MEQLTKLTAFLREREYAVEDLERFAELIEPITDCEGWHGYRLRPLTQADRVTHRCRALIHYTWHCQDHVKKLLTANGVADANRVVNEYIKASPNLQAISYLANEHKHAGIDAGMQRWSVDLAPRLGKPFVVGRQLSFPCQLKPTIMLWGDSIPAVEFTGRAGIGDEEHEFTEFEWLFSCKVEDKDGKPIGNVWDMCNGAFRTWLDVLSDHGFAV